MYVTDMAYLLKDESGAAKVIHDIGIENALRVCCRLLRAAGKRSIDD